MSEVFSGVYSSSPYFSVLFPLCGSAETPKTMVLELLVRRSGELLKQGVMKGAFGYSRKRGHSS